MDQVVHALVDGDLDPESLANPRADALDLAADQLDKALVPQRRIDQVGVPKWATCSGLKRRVSAALTSTTVTLSA